MIMIRTTIFSVFSGALAMLSGVADAQENYSWNEGKARARVLVELNEPLPFGATAKHRCDAVSGHSRKRTRPRQFVCSCAGQSRSSEVWGSGPYTYANQNSRYQSSICAAAKHAGVIDDLGGAVRVIVVPGMETTWQAPETELQRNPTGRQNSASSLVPCHREHLPTLLAILAFDKETSQEGTSSSG